MSRKRSRDGSRATGGLGSTAPLVDDELVRHLSQLAQLRVSDSEGERLAIDLECILTYVEKLEELDLSEIEPTHLPHPLPTRWREDDPRPGLTEEEALANAPERAVGGFGVPKVIEP